MKCPECGETFALTWARYFRAPLGRLSCPDCGARLAFGHRWFYWPGMALGGAVMCAPLAWLGYRFTGSIVVTLACAALGWAVSGLPADWWLESRFAVLRVVGGQKVVYPLKPDAETPDEN